MHFLVISIILFCLLDYFFLHALSVKTNDPRKILETASRARLLNPAHCKNANEFGALALPGSESTVIMLIKVNKMTEFTAAQSRRKRILCQLI